MGDIELARPSIDPISDILKWILLVVAILCFALMAWATVLTYEKAPPQPLAFTDQSGTVIMTAGDIVTGKGGFQKADLMDYGSIYGMGSYFGEDYTASTLVRLGALTKQNLSNSAATPPRTQAPANQSLAITGPAGMPPLPTTPAPATLPAALSDAAVSATMQKQLQGIDLTQPRVVLPDAVAQAVRQLQSELSTKLNTVNLSAGWVPAKSLNPALRVQTADFIIYAAMTTVARRPDNPSTSWTENWPYEPTVGNVPTTNTFQWTWISFCFTFFAMGFVLWLYRAYLDHPDDAPKEQGLATYRTLTPSQVKTGKYFIVVALVFLASQGAGAIMAHSYYDRETFYGVQLNYILPYNFLRSFHLQAPIIWIGLGWIASGLFIAPAIAGGREAKGQGFLVDLLFWVSLFVVAAALLGNYLGIQGVIDKGWFWFGNQGLSYIQLGRFWQILFFVALLSWSGLMFRALWPSRDTLAEATRQFWTGKIRLEHLIWAATINVAILYAFGMIPLTGIEKSFTLTDFWRWWVVHLWVEQSFEFFAVAMSAYLLMSLGLVSRKLAERSVYLELILIFMGGVLGTGHHLYWAGGPGMWVPLGSMFSFIEVLPLVLLILEAISQHRAIKAAQGLEGFDYGLAYLYILGSAFWNFVGAGVFGGGTLNAPLVNYYEHGTFLTLNHAHTSLFGAFGLLALGLIYFCLRYRAGPDVEFNETPGRIAFWCYNLGLVMWIFLHFFPIGWPQLNAVYEHGYAWARSQAFYDQTRFWQWMRLPGDVVFSVGTLIMAWDFLIKLWTPRGGVEGTRGSPAAVPAE
ncbi:MAG TPA: cbb3-type cytochrome c oxidase subunit I [Sphingomicrobium sp.]|nr:cbb3-type cytochrome c oxidase subunit I [Sphingomicrobium sp.]